MTGTPKRDASSPGAQTLAQTRTFVLFFVHRLSAVHPQEHPPKMHSAGPLDDPRHYMLGHWYLRAPKILCWKP